MAQRKEPTDKPRERLKYTDELGAEICAKVSCSPYMLEELCKENPAWPCSQTIYEWRLKYPEFGGKYAIAKQQQIEPLVNHIFMLTRDKSEDFVQDKKGNLIANTVRQQRMRSEVDAIKWLAGKLAPKLYGDKLVDSKTGENLIQKIIDKL